MKCKYCDEDAAKIYGFLNEGDPMCTECHNKSKCNFLQSLSNRLGNKVQPTHTYTQVRLH